MERPERKIFNFLQIAQQAEENRRYEKAVKDYEEWVKLDRERQKLENERLKLENEQMRASTETLRKQEGLGNVEQMYDRVKPQQEEPKKEHWLVKLWKS